MKKNMRMEEKIELLSFHEPVTEGERELTCSHASKAQPNKPPNHKHTVTVSVESANVNINLSHTRKKNGNTRESTNSEIAQVLTAWENYRLGWREIDSKHAEMEGWRSGNKEVTEMVQTELGIVTLRRERGSRSGVQAA